MVPMSLPTLVEQSPLVDAIRLIEMNRKRIAVVLTEDGRLAGTLTDGDVRRCLLAGGTLETPVKEAMNASPLSAFTDSSEGHLLDLMRARNVLAIPIVDRAQKFVDLVHITDLVSPEKHQEDAPRFEFAVIMAGGEGMRLRPLTESTPKPMLDVGGMPLLERQIVRVRESGVRDIYIAVKFLSHVIEEYFGAGDQLGVTLRYLREKEPAGTAGALSLLPHTPAAPILVMNGDVLTTSDLGSLLEFHLTQGAHVTAAAIDYRINIPYGVFSTDGPSVRSLAEKPSQRFLCNAGIYAVSPAALSLIPKGRPFNMTDLICACLDAGEKVSVFPVHEYWSDIGTPAELEAARVFFQKASSL
jgi:dTDP-glucose pyrophosphorylase